MFESFTERARKVMSMSRQEAQARNQTFISTEHVLIGILREGGGVAAKVLSNCGITLVNAMPKIDKIEPPLTGPAPALSQLPFSPRMKQVLELAYEEASRASHNIVGSEHILLGLFLEGDGVARKILEEFDVTENRLRKEMHEVLGDEAGRVAGGHLSKPLEMRINLFAPLEGGAPKTFLVVNGVMYAKTGSITLSGVSPNRYESIAKLVAGDMGCHMYTVEIS